MSATSEPSSECSRTAMAEPPYRLRKPAGFFPALTASYVQRVVASTRRSGANSPPCATLSAEGTPETLQSIDKSARDKLAELRMLIKTVAALAADVGAESGNKKIRALCFGFSGCCARVAADIRREQLWSDVR